MSYQTVLVRHRSDAAAFTVITKVVFHSDMVGVPVDVYSHRVTAGSGIISLVNDIVSARGILT